MRKFVNYQGETVEIFTEPFRTKTKSPKWILRFKSPKGDVTRIETVDSEDEIGGVLNKHGDGLWIEQAT